MFEGLADSLGRFLALCTQSALLGDVAGIKWVSVRLVIVGSPMPDDDHKPASAEHCSKLGVAGL